MIYSHKSLAPEAPEDDWIKKVLSWFILVWLLGSFAPLFPSAAQTLPRSILVLEQSDVRGPFYAAIFSAFRARVNAAGAPVSIYVENLDLNRFGGPEYQQGLQDLFHVKYRNRPIGTVVAVGPGALRYALRWRSTSWPDVPVVFAFVDATTVASLALPDDVTGITVHLSLADMVLSARAVVDDLDHVALVGDRFELQSSFKHFGEEVPAIARELNVIDLTGLPMVELRERIAALPDKSAILYTAIYSDGAGTYFPPADGVAMIAAVAKRPIIAPIETYIDRGAVGGYVSVPSVIGEEAAELALRIIDGEAPSSIPVAMGNSIRPVFDWPSMQLWGVSESDLPAGSEVRNRVEPLWRQHPRETLAVSALVILQTAFIALLLYEHRRRQVAEIEARTRITELAHMNRRATASELSSSIAHEVNQPLGSILNDVHSAEKLLESPNPDLGQIKEVVYDIKRNNLRASSIISRLRNMLKKDTIDPQDIDLNDIVRDVFDFVSVEASEVEVLLHQSLASEPLLIKGDPIQLQQVVLNLVLNGIDAVRDVEPTQRRITCRTWQANEAAAELSMSDSGPPVSEDTIARLFEPFFTTKEQGMGMGLPIARTIIEMHGGSIRAEASPAGIVVFRICLPLAHSSRGNAFARPGSHRG